MRATYLVDRRWCAGITTLRQPVELPIGFGPRPSLSLFLYNEDGGQAIARPYLDGPPVLGKKGPSPPADHSSMNGETGHPAPLGHLFPRRFTTIVSWGDRTPSRRRVKPLERTPLVATVVSANLSSGYRAAVEFAVVDNERIDFRAVLSRTAELLPLFTA